MRRMRTDGNDEKGQTQPLWNAISPHPCRVCSKTQKKHVQSVQYTIHCTVHSTQYTVHGLQYTSHSIQYTLCSIQYEVYSTQYTVYSTHCTIQSIQHTVHSIQYTVQQYTVHTTRETTKGGQERKCDACEPTERTRKDMEQENNTTKEKQ